ncbi:MAG TPA: response regulator [Ignavibacteriaceae bacterium]|nr:response regulator [Ignavibacteriaceae bacterium]
MYGRKTVLVAEDEGVIALDLSIFLNLNNFDVVQVRTGKNLLLKYQEHNPSLIISDLKLIRVNLSLQTALMEINKHYGIPVIIISGESESEIKKIASSFSNCTYLIKPFDNNELLRMILSIIKGES